MPPSPNARRARSGTSPCLGAREFDLGFVTGKSWSGYNYYKGGYRSRIEVNTDLPIRISRAVDLGCHEGYPGHHVLNTLLEQHLAKGRGWIEYSVYPLYSPQSLLAEGSANYGIELAFPGREKLAYEVKALYPLAGLSDRRRRTLRGAAGCDEGAGRRPLHHRPRPAGGAHRRRPKPFA